MATAAHTAVLRLQGTSTAFTNAATTKLVANTVYRITDDAKRLLDPSQTVTVEVDATGGGSWAAATGYTLDRLFGVVTFASDQGASALVRVSGYYLPLVDMVGITDFSFSASRDVLETTALDGDGTKTKKLGLKDLSGSLTLNELLTVTHGAGAPTLQSALSSATPLLLEYAAGGKRFRAWVLLESGETTGAVADLLGSSVNFQGSARGEGAAYAWEA